jgi:hypothetical protein
LGQQAMMMVLRFRLAKKPKITVILSRTSSFVIF